MRASFPHKFEYTTWYDSLAHVGIHSHLWTCHHSWGGGRLWGPDFMSSSRTVWEVNHTQIMWTESRGRIVTRENWGAFNKRRVNVIVGWPKKRCLLQKGKRERKERESSWGWEKVEMVPQKLRPDIRDTKRWVKCPSLRSFHVQGSLLWIFLGWPAGTQHSTSARALMQCPLLTCSICGLCHCELCWFVEQVGSIVNASGEMNHYLGSTLQNFRT